jgi:peptidoglycan hydrolase-like protein with peptidoglycan-binding domain
MQEKLLKLGYDLGRDGADGDFGTMTEAAVRKFQSKYGLEVDGIVGAETTKKIDELLKGDSPPEQPSDDSYPTIGLEEIALGSKGNLVKLAQSALACLGYSVSTDGIFGNEFEKKIKEFQAGNALRTDGVVGKETWKKLLDIPFRTKGSNSR